MSQKTDQLDCAVVRFVNPNLAPFAVLFAKILTDENGIILTDENGFVLWADD